MPFFTSSRPTQSPDAALRGALPELKAAELKLRQNAAGHGITYAIAEFGGIRTLTDTTKAMGYRDADYAVYVKQMQAAGKTPLAKETWRPIQPYGNSYHNYGAAFDVYVTSVPEGRTQSWGLDMLQIAAPVVGLRNGASFNDPPHFELPVSLSSVKDMWAKFTGGTGTPAKSGSTSVAVLAGVGAVALLVLLVLTRKSA